jgi:hypothetical protein
MERLVEKLERENATSMTDEERSFNISQEGVEEMVYQLPQVVRNCSCCLTKEYLLSIARE